MNKDSQYSRAKNFPISWSEWDECQKGELDSWHWNLYERPEMRPAKNKGIIVRQMRLNWDDETEEIIDPEIDGKSIIEMGAGVLGQILYVKNLKKGTAVEPLKFPEWVLKRYEEHNVKFVNLPSELVTLESLGEFEKYDEAWIAGVLQHVLDPTEILRNMAKIAKKVRLSEWVDMPPHKDHPWMITQEMIHNTLDPIGKVIWTEKVYIDQQGETTLRGWLVNCLYDTEAYK